MVFFRNGEHLKTRILQFYAVLGIHVIDTTCTFEDSIALTFLTLFFEQTIEGRPAFRRTASRRHGKLKLDLNEKSFQCSKTWYCCHHCLTNTFHFSYYDSSSFLSQLVLFFTFFWRTLHALPIRPQKQKHRIEMYQSYFLFVHFYSSPVISHLFDF